MDLVRVHLDVTLALLSLLSPAQTVSIYPGQN